MAASFDEVMGRTGADNRLAREKREEVVAQIIKDVEQTSTALALGNVHQMGAYQERLRVANSVPDAFWINGTTTAGDAPFGSSNTDSTNQFAKDSGLKQTTNMTWDNLFIRPDELAVLVPMPDSWQDDSDLAWDEIRASVGTAFAQAIDAAIFWGKSTTGHPLPTSFGTGIVHDAIAAGAFVVEGTGVDVADDYALLLQGLEERGFNATSAYVNAAESWRLRRLRSGGPEGLPIYQSLDAGGNATIYGRQLKEETNGTFRPTMATAIAGEFSNLHIGIRQNLTFRMFDEGTIQNAAGVTIYNAMQQDGQILRAVMRLGYVVADPYKYQTGQREFPFELLLPVGYSS